MKKDIGAVASLYPMPLVVIGIMIDGKPNWTSTAHVGIVGLGQIMLSIRKGRYSNKHIFENKRLSVNIVTEDMLAKADYVGIVSGSTTDKSMVFDYDIGNTYVPIIKDSPIVMECKFSNVYNLEFHNNFILNVLHTHVEESAMTNGRIDFMKAKPVLFEMPTMNYMSLGDVIGKCWREGQKYKDGASSENDGRHHRGEVVEEVTKISINYSEDGENAKNFNVEDDNDLDVELDIELDIELNAASEESTELFDSSNYM